MTANWLIFTEAGCVHELSFSSLDKFALKLNDGQVLRLRNVGEVKDKLRDNGHKIKEFAQVDGHNFPIQPHRGNNDRNIDGLSSV